MAYNKSSSRMAYANASSLFSNASPGAGRAGSITTSFCFRSYTVRLLPCNLHPQHFVHTSRTHAGSLVPPPQLKVPPLNKTSVLEGERQADPEEAAGSICRGLCFQRRCLPTLAELSGWQNERQKTKEFHTYRMHFITTKEF